MKASELAKALADAGAPMEAILIALREVEAREDQIASKRAMERDRKRRQRAKDTDWTVTGQSRDTGGTVTAIPSLSPAPFLSPHTPQTNPHPHTHPSIYIPRVKGGDFPMLDCTDPATWADFRANRKAKRLPCTASAHAKLIRDLETMSARIGWPPGEVFRACVERGWGAIYDPTEGEAKQNGRKQHADRESTSDIARRLASMAQAGRPEAFGTG